MSSQPITPLTYRGPFFRDDIKEPLVLKRSRASSVILYIAIGFYGEFLPIFLLGLVGFIGVDVPRDWYIASFVAIPAFALLMLVKTIHEQRALPEIVLCREGISETQLGKTIRFSPWNDLEKVHGWKVYSSIYDKPFVLDLWEFSPGFQLAKRFLSQQMEEIVRQAIQRKSRAHYMRCAVSWTFISGLCLIVFPNFLKAFPLEMILDQSPLLKGAWILGLSLLVVGFIGGCLGALIFLSYLEDPAKKKRQVNKAVEKLSSDEVNVFVNLCKGVYKPVALRPNTWFRYLDENVLWRSKVLSEQTGLGIAGVVIVSLILGIGTTSTPPFPIQVTVVSIAALLAVFVVMALGIRNTAEFKRTKGAQFSALREGGILIRLASGKDVHATILPHRRWPAGSPRFFGSRTIRLHGDDGRYYRYDPHFLVPILPGRITARF